MIIAALLLVPPAHASPRQESVFQDDDLLLNAPAETVDASMAELASLGADRVRLTVLWRLLAPDVRPANAADPGAYSPERFVALDHAVASARAHGLSVLLNVRGGAPEWAQGSKRPRRLADFDAYRPSAKAFGQFVRMLGRRYDGTYAPPGGEPLARVDAWSIWNEPNWRTLLSPQSQHGRPVAPALYRRLLRAASAALAATGHGADVILMGETAPLGERKPGLENSLYAGRFYRELFCLDRRLRPRSHCGDFAKRGPLTATGVAHHPYPVLAPPEFRSFGKDEIRLADGRKLARIIDAARRAHRVNGRLPIWYTEFGYQTAPPDPYRGVSLRRQAAWNVRAEYLAYRDRRVLSFDQFLLRDGGPRPEYPTSDRRYWSNYQTGLRFADGRAKPSLDAYRLPFLRLRHGRFWGMVRPGANGVAQTIRLERRADAKAPWESVGAHQVTDPHGYFTLRVRAAGRRQYRFVWRDLASLPAVKK
ncbi:MAG: hypothetical protein QOI80_1000 [Solirubrobacteraceae bacterium]|jgi:hypothetical protein|nr:hypothetical protein [Solirubrobacteraceae bacterium]